MISLTYPPFLNLARSDTPLRPLKRLSEELGLNLLCKQDDLTGAALSGNKIRKLEFLLAEACSGNYTGVITCGGEQSNHARATAVAAAQLGLRCKLLLRTADTANPPRPDGNILLDRMVGADIHWLTPKQYAQRDQLMADMALQQQQDVGAKLYPIPEGGSNALGAWGYVRCAEELSRQLGPVPATVVCAVGSGGTAAGLIAGCRLLALPYRVIGICVCDTRAYFQQRIAEILEEMAAQFDVDVTVPKQEIEIWEDYVGRGYALSRDEELLQMLRIARLEGLLTDPVYSGKALFGLLSELEQGTRLQGPVVFLHTGGIYGLFAKAEQLAPLLVQKD